MASSGAVAAAAFARVGIAGLLATGQAACTARDEGAAFKTLSEAEARELEAIAARILPTTDTPGAREAGVIHFIDQSLGSFMQGSLETARAGLAEFQATVPAEYPGARTFSDLDPQDQDAWLRARENSGFFEFMRFMTLAGFFAMSSYGGNRDHVGWKLIGLDGAPHAWQPPFGWYDAQYTESQSESDD